MECFSLSLGESARIHLGLTLSYRSAFCLCLLITFDIGVMISLPLARAGHSQINASFVWEASQLFHLYELYLNDNN